MKKLLCTLALFGASCYAQTTAERIDHMVAECDAVMAADVCRVELDAKDYPAPTILVAGVGRISTASYLRIRGAGDGMCALVREVCTAQWAGEDCRAARALWRQK